jgi:hypothetical protein
MGQCYLFYFKLSVCGPGSEGTFLPGPQTVALKVKEITLPHYILVLLMMG